MYPPARGDARGGTLWGPMEEISCVTCGGDFTIEKERREAHRLYECRVCKVQFWWPFKNPGTGFYGEVPALAARNLDPHSHPLFPSQRRFLKTAPKRGGTLLDLGMGTGNFLAEAQKRGYRVTGCDFDGAAVAAAKSAFNLTDVHACSVEEFLKQNPARRFDVITMFEVIEHLDDFAIFDTIRLLLAPGGIVVLSTPNRRRWTPFMRGDDPPRHLTRWNEESLKNFLERKGFSDIKVKFVPVVFNRFIMRFSEWTAGWLSFGLARKAELSLTQTPRARRAAAGGTLRLLSKIKLYGLFFIPACILYSYLWLTGRRNCTALYAVAKRI
ncbi:MAG: hypothetical protein UY84_C0001G0263 [Candidatus Adlerbacteria bacterium GW2011_GWA2_54_12]|nr:MAG: hypothetical protein UY84_C0001G0263 [Candidatus Adlerbacteria bacterium GW2011_GWA2_54_12]